MIPSRPTHPGKVLRDEIESRGITQTKLANEIGMRVSLLNELINGKRDFTIEYALQDWIMKVKQAQWHSLKDIRQTFNSVDYVGNQRYVFNIKGNDYRLVVVIQFTPQFVYVRFIGTHSEYDRIDCSKI